MAIGVGDGEVIVANSQSGGQGELYGGGVDDGGAGVQVVEGSCGSGLKVVATDHERGSGQEVGGGQAGGGEVVYEWRC